MSKVFLLLCLIFISFSAEAQILNQNNSLPQSIYRYPQDYFRYPLDLPPSTAGSFGELRANHFHSGLDFKTNQRIGFPVHAVADGYISRLRVQYGGFGLAVYIDHPNGYTSVYGHLDHLTPELAKTIKDYQYKNHIYEADFNLPAGQIIVKKGDVFAWSGNAGASAGPHLHFEIRETASEKTINPQLFGLVIPDRVPPTIYNIAVYHFNGLPFSENTAKQMIAIAGANGNYQLKTASPLHLNGDCGFAITTNDMNSTSMNHNGVYSIQLNEDGKIIYQFTVDKFAFDQTHSINSHLDYPAFLSTNRWLQKSFVAPGNQIGLYSGTINQGVINFNDNALHKLQYVIKDVAGNTSTLAFEVQAGSAVTVNMPAAGDTFFKANQENTFTQGNLSIDIPAGNLYDDLDFKFAVLPKKPGAYSPTYRLQNRFTPINDSFEIAIKPDIPLGKYVDEAVIVKAGGAAQKATFTDGIAKTKVRSFGDYYLAVDTIAPVIVPINIADGKNMRLAKDIIFRTSDNLSGVAVVNGYIDGQWVLFEHDYKTKLYRYFFDEHCLPGKHQLEIVVKDLEENEKHLLLNFYR